MTDKLQIAKEALQLSEMELISLYGRYGYNGSNVLDKVSKALTLLASKEGEDEDEDLQKQVRKHIATDKLFDWNEALTFNEMTYLEQLLLTFCPITQPGSIAYEQWKNHIQKCEAQPTSKGNEEPEVMDNDLVAVESTGKEYDIDSFQKLCNVIDTKNCNRLIIDLGKSLILYAYGIEEVRKSNPKETKNKTNFKILKFGFRWIDDGKHDLKHIDITDSNTGENTRINVDIEAAHPTGYDNKGVKVGISADGELVIYKRTLDGLHNLIIDEDSLTGLSYSFISTTPGKYDSLHFLDKISVMQMVERFNQAATQPTSKGNDLEPEAGEPILNGRGKDMRRKYFFKYQLGGVETIETHITAFLNDAYHLFEQKHGWPTPQIVEVWSEEYATHPTGYDNKGVEENKNSNHKQNESI